MLKFLILKPQSEFSELTASASNSEAHETPQAQKTHSEYEDSMTCIHLKMVCGPSV